MKRFREDFCHADANGRRMPSIADRYRRLDARVRGFSRTRYALTVGVFVFAGTLGVRVLLGEPEMLQALMMGIAFTVVYYVMNPNQSESTSE